MRGRGGGGEGKEAGGRATSSDLLTFGWRVLGPRRREQRGHVRPPVVSDERVNFVAHEVAAARIGREREDAGSEEG